MNSHERKWYRLVALARRAGSDGAPSEPPPGFVTRVAALGRAARLEGLAPDRLATSIWQVLAVRSFGVACLVTVLAIAAAWPVVGNAANDDMADLADPLLVADASP